MARHCKEYWYGIMFSGVEILSPLQTSACSSCLEEEKEEERRRDNKNWCDRREQNKTW